MRRLPCLSAIALAICVFSCTAAPKTGTYDAKVHFRKEVPIQFPDFELTYLGDRRIGLPQYPRGFLYHDFRVKNGGTQIVSWTTGTGVIEPREFTAAGILFDLELARSEKLGKLDRDEVVISKRSR